MNITAFGYLLSFLGVIILDRITKHLALLYFVVPQHIYSWLTLELVYNRGISWGILHEYSEYLGSMITIMVALVLGVLAWYAQYRHRCGASILPELMVFAGACSNLWDRIFYPGVIDFIHLHLGSWHWAIFNVADCAITLGVVAMLIKQYYEGTRHDIL
jgi:signal peptidase II